MCGIFCCVSKCSSTDFGEAVLEGCKHLLNNRGPDYAGSIIYDNRILMYGSILWQQGSETTRQPIQSDRFVLLFNGDLFIDRGNTNASDTQWLFDRITSAVFDIASLADVFKELKGPFSLILLDKSLRRIYFARDSLGRNSLLLGQSEEGFIITSVLGRNTSIGVVEIPPNGIYYADMDGTDIELNLFPWKHTNNHEIDSLSITDDLIYLPWMTKDVIPNAFSFHHVLNTQTPEETDTFDYLLNHSCIADLCDRLLNVLTESVRERVVNTPNHCKACMASKQSCEHPRVGILFSGGIDCTILALLADSFVPAHIPICLLNVAFEKIIRPGNPEYKKHMANSTDIDWDVPDRITGHNSWKELQLLKPNREWTFVEINVTRMELQNYKNRISDLVFPLKSVLDESLGAALWFASRGRGLANNSEYNSLCRVMLLGSGADELFGGYSRHRAAFYRSIVKAIQPSEESILTGFNNLMAELELDWDRLPSRNLARDDRIIGDHGVTPRTPYLQEDFISIVRSLNADQRCYHPLGEGIGDKLTLRLCAYKLGLRQSCKLRKRALQFGSRIADRKQNANDSSSFLSS
ncbi:asparagine synthetase domain-containing protein CG17486-like isoform X3 [Armigeres subalbatus]|uniref:asparagine synthetase domain-containing protein CG17486-like isoform X3 n=1 Tax=Armigeres subalbatus TaxID=124917 RepID=UPI002ED628AA